MAKAIDYNKIGYSTAELVDLWHERERAAQTHHDKIAAALGRPTGTSQQGPKVVANAKS
jgi:hypothetical protein